MHELLSNAKELTGDQEWLAKDTSFVTVTMEVDKKAASEWLPFGLTLDKPYRAIYFIGDYPNSSFGSVYKEAAVFIPVRFGPIKALFVPWMLVDDDRALILGREILGSPKKLGSMTFSENNGIINATTDRKGTQLLKIEGKKTEIDHSPAPVFGMAHSTVWGAMSSSSLGLQFITLMFWTEEILECYKVDATIDIKGSKTDPIDSLKPGRILESRFYRINFGKLWNFPIPVFPVAPTFSLRNLHTRYR